MEAVTIERVFPEDHKEGYGDQSDDNYPDGTIKCENSQFGEYGVPDIEIMNAAKKMASAFFKNHRNWGAKKVARKVAEKLKLKKFDGVIRDNFFGVLNDTSEFEPTSDAKITVEDVRDWKRQLDEAGIKGREYDNPIEGKGFSRQEMDEDALW